MSLKASLEPAYFMRRGMRVRIVDGPFAGIEGVISHRRGKYRIILNVDEIEMAAAVEVNAYQVEPIDALN